ncbi:MAG: hypothetical protein R3C26_13310 [Calditrichia bacterium]
MKEIELKFDDERLNQTIGKCEMLTKSGLVRITIWTKTGNCAPAIFTIKPRNPSNP